MLIFGTAGVGLAVMAYLFMRVAQIAVDNAKAAHIAQAIRTGALTFLREEYTIISAVSLVVAGLLYAALGIMYALLFLFGAALSLLAGVIGMHAATKANVRTTLAARTRGERAAFLVALSGGGVMGFAVASFGLIGLGAIFYWFYGVVDSVVLENYLICFGIGASLVAAPDSALCAIRRMGAPAV